MKKKIVHVVPHSHWDREWYFTIEDSNVLLAENMYALLRFLRDHPEFPAYVFDGQYSVIDEYLQWHPEDRELISDLVTARRLYIGPWYTQADTRLVHIESLIRNLLYGIQLSSAMGHSMDIGYLPDVFGQNAYLPSIFKDFGIAKSIVQRGIYNDQLSSGDVNMLWTSPDNVQVPMNYIYFGYGPGKFLQADEAYLNEHLLPILSVLSDLNTNTDVLLLPAGGDQVFVREQFPDVVARLNAMQEQYHFVLSDYEHFMEEAWQQPEKFTTELKNELVASQKSRIHTTIASQRYDIKEANSRIEHKILNILEPMLTFAKVQGISDYPQKQLDTVWKQLFDVHAHDSIGGCNSDTTNAAIMARLASCERIVNDLLNIVQKRIAHAAITDDCENKFIVFNSDIHDMATPVRTTVFSRAESIKILNKNNQEVPFSCFDKKYISGGSIVVATANGEQQIEQPGYYQFDVQLYNQTLPAWQLAIFTIEENPEMPLLIEDKSATIQNSFYTIGVEAGELYLENKHGRINNFIRFEDVADAGDSYDFSPLIGDVSVFGSIAGDSVQVRRDAFMQQLLVETELKIAANLVDRQAGVFEQRLTIATIITLQNDAELIQVQHEIVNGCKDHRIRAVITTGFDIKQNLAKQGFGMLQRELENPRAANWREMKFAEKPQAIHALDQLVQLQGGTGQQLLLVSQALKEYEVVSNRELAVTLFRSVGLLGRDDLVNRPGRASGINNIVVPTPDAQMQQTMSFSYGVVAVTPQQPLYNYYEQLYPRYTVYQKQKMNTFHSRLERFELPMNMVQWQDESMIQLDNPALSLSVLKQASHADEIIVRCFNLSETVQQGTFALSAGWQICQSRLLEDKCSSLADNKIELAPNNYITIKTKRG
ncbi:glycosyl hydrolase-related protein [Culicoidibacter larvae]|uniref:Alpha-mannosidase n=1 Tax=Culicoidibacter larvae TaxID=2579976 RepID=A0A5R8QFX2_9FIRM|nr:glycosyl hydrolase-related protein [Culicoidibacter larvae]TLG76684.1 alpha-mannosidase [Culicoidibacter larvae]